MSNFNLQIKDYNINELKDLLNLVDPYSLEDIINNENELREKLLMDANVSKAKKQGISQFLRTTREILLKLKKEDFANLPTDELVGNPNHPIPKRIHDVVEKINAVPRDETTVEGVSKNTMHKLLCLDSRFRDNYYSTLSTDYKLTLPTVIKNVVSMELSALEFPTSYFQVSKSLGNNYLWLKWSCPVRNILAGILQSDAVVVSWKEGLAGAMPPQDWSAVLPPSVPPGMPEFTNDKDYPRSFIFPEDICTNRKVPWGATPPPTTHEVPAELLVSAQAMAAPVPQSSLSEDFNPEQLWYYVAVPDGNYQREPMMRALNDQFKIATQPREALIYLFQQLGAYYVGLPLYTEDSTPAPFTDGKYSGWGNAWIPYEHLEKFLHGTVAYPQASIDEFSLRTVISYVQGNATWNALCKTGDPPWPGNVKSNANTMTGDFSTTGFDPPAPVGNNIAFAYAPGLTVETLLSLVNNPKCFEWLSLYFNRSSEGEGATSYIARRSTTGSRYSGGTDIPPALDLRPDGGVVSNYGWILGYRLGFYQGATAYVSEGCYDGWGIKYIYIVVNDYNKNVNNFCIPSYNESLGRSNVLARVSTNAVASADYNAGISLTNNVNQDNSLKKRIYFGPVDISRLELQITDELGRILDLNNMDYSMAVNLICLYD